MSRTPSGRRPGPDELAPGWGWSANTPEAQIRQASSIAGNVRRRQRGWRARMGTAVVIVALCAILVPILLGVLLS